MCPGCDLGLLAGAVALGAVHGIEPGHGWPVAAAYALDPTAGVADGIPREWDHRRRLTLDSFRPGSESRRKHRSSFPTGTKWL